MKFIFWFSGFMLMFGVTVAVWTLLRPSHDGLWKLGMILISLFWIGYASLDISHDISR